MVDRELADIHEDAKTCLVLCSRVLSVISVKEIKVRKLLKKKKKRAQILVNLKIKL